MFTKYQLDDGRNVLVEQLGQPIVYFDNWALNDIALEFSFRERFIAIMKDRNGTLRLSISNIVELLKQTDQDQIEAILSMVDSVDSGFINTSFVEVINLENGILRGEVDENPSQEMGLVLTYLLAQNWPESWTVSGVIRSALENSSGKKLSESWVKFSDRMKTFLDSVRSDKEYTIKSRARANSTRKKGKEYDRATRELFLLGFDFVLQNSAMTMSSNEWHDFFHSIVPVAYCDLVLLDKRWTTFVHQTRLTFPNIAFAFDRTSIDLFFSTLETVQFAENDSPHGP